MNDNKEENKIKLKVVSELLPTGKAHISFSEMMDWVDCSWRHKLKHIDKIPIEEESEHLMYGSIIHDAIEDYLNGTKPLDWEVTSLKVREELSKLQKFKEAPDEIDEWCNSIKLIFDELPSWLEKTFPKYKVVEAEHQLQETIENKPGRFFKGFIDIILENPVIQKGKPSSEPLGVEYLIGDWKSSGSGWSNSKKNDQYKKMQMILYKYFWCRKTGIDPKNVKCAWILLKRNAKPGQHIELVPVSSEQKDIDGALQKVSEMISLVEKKIFHKNRNACMFCPYKHTKHCP
jgi:hypothetical protein